jgi:predicted permease
MDTLLQNVRYGLRQMWRSPLFTAAAVATLALGIGANTALFTLVSAIMTKPLPGIQDAGQLVWIMSIDRDGRPRSLSYPDFVDYRNGLAGVQLSGTSEAEFSVSGRGTPERVDGQAVSGNYFSIVRAPMALGRGFTPAEDSIGNAQPAVVISHLFWQRRFAGDSSIVGQQVIVNSIPLTVVGVAAEGFNGADIESPRALWVPMATYRVLNRSFSLDGRRSRWMKALGRMPAGMTIADLNPSVTTIAARIAAEDSAGHFGMTARAYSAKAGLPPGAEREALPVAIVASVVTGLVLLIACANVSNLLLARGVGRRREVGIRLSLGASRWRLVGQLLTESSLLALLSAATGILLAYIATDYLLASGVLPLTFSVTPDARVVTFTAGAAAFAAIAFGLVPAIEATRTNLVGAVKDGGSGRDPRRTRLQSTFVVAQLSLSLVLLTTAGLFLRSLYKANSVEVGYEASSQVLALSFDLGLQGYNESRANAFLSSIGTRAAGLPGVEGVSFTDIPPMGNRYNVGSLHLEGDDENARARMHVNQASVHPGYFKVIGMQILRGRDFATTDDRSAPRVVIISQDMATQFWPGADPIGKRIGLWGASGPMLTVVGVATDAMLGGPTEDRRSTAYIPQAQYPANNRLTLLVRSAGDATQLGATLRREFAALDADLPLADVQTLKQYKETKLAARKDGATILAGFGALALLLASIGVFGVMAFSVMQRTREIGIRIALGARTSEVVTLFVKRGMRLTMIGVGIGMALSVGVSQLLQGMLFGLTPTDGATFVGVAALLALVSLLATWLPSRRAARVDPLSALRSE